MLISFRCMLLVICRKDSFSRKCKFFLPIVIFVVGIGNNRLVKKRFDVFPRDAFAAATGRNNTEIFHFNG